MKQEEHKIQSAFFDWLRLNEKRFPELKWFFAIPNGGNRNIVTAVKLKREGVKKGVLDVFNPLSNGRGTKGIWIEFKSGNGKITKEQGEFIDMLGGNNYRVFIVNDWKEAAKGVIDFFDLPIKI